LRILRISGLLRKSEIDAALAAGARKWGSETRIKAGIDAGKTQKAVLQVRKWREKGEWPFPDFSAEPIAKTNNQPESPPADSALGSKKKE